MKRKNILLLGSDGQLGWELSRTLQPLGLVHATALAPRGVDIRQLDLTNEAALLRTLDEVQPDIVVNAAAFTDVDGAEEQREAAFQLNARTPAIIAEHNPGLFVHFSTDYVFDGVGGTPYMESDTPRPLNVYGESKLAGEQAALGGRAPTFVLRTSWLYSARGRNFFLTMQKLARERRKLKIVDDQTGCPTWARPLAEAAAQIIAQSNAQDETWLKSVAGLSHLSATSTCTWYEFARAIFSLVNPGHADELLSPCTSAEYATQAARPSYSVLDCRRAETLFGLNLGSFQEHLPRVFEELSGIQEVM